MYEALEEEREQIDEMYMQEPDVIEDPNSIVVEYDWIEQNENIAPEKQFELVPLKPKIEGSRLNRSDDDVTVKVVDNGVKLYQCDICMRTFKERSKLKSHKEIHTNLRNVICPTCGKAFKTQACLRSHKRVHNPTYMQCDICGMFK